MNTRLHGPLRWSAYLKKKKNSPSFVGIRKVDCVTRSQVTAPTTLTSVVKRLYISWLFNTNLMHKYMFKDN